MAGCECSPERRPSPPPRMGQHELAVERERGFERHKRLPCDDPFCKSFVKPARFRFSQPGANFDACRTQVLETTPRDGRICVRDGRHDALDASQNQRIRAWPGASTMATRLQVDV